VVTAAIGLALALLIALAVVSPALASSALGSTDSFWVYDWGAGKDFQVQATARFVGDHVAIYVATNVSVPAATLNALGNAFSSTVYPTLTTALGSIPDPGIDGDSRVAIVIYDFRKTGMEGAFRPADIDPDAEGKSNRREMFYLDSGFVLLEPWNAPAVAAHEFAHLVLHYQDVMLDTTRGGVPEFDWVQEGICGYAEHLCGYDDRTDAFLLAFERDSNTNLTAWEGDRQHYGASYSFIRYLAGREGKEFIRRLVQEPLDGVAGVNATLIAMGRDWETFNSLFDDWVVAGFLDQKRPYVWEWVFDDLDVAMVPVVRTGPEPLLGKGSVGEHAALYYDFPVSERTTTFQAVIDGADGTPLQAALISWDSSGVLLPSVQRLNLANPAAGDTVTSPSGYDRHTLVVWARGLLNNAGSSYLFTYSGAADPPGGVQFLDMDGSAAYYPYVSALVRCGVVGGKEIPPGSGLWFFQGTEKVTRAQFAKMIMLATGLHTAEIDNPFRPSFRDVKLGVDEDGQPAPYPYDFIEEAATLGIVNGFSDGTFRPFANITRGQLAAMIVRGARAAGRPLAPYTGSQRVFADVPYSAAADSLYVNVMTAYQAGILSGSPRDGALYFNPSSSAQRNHVAKMTANLMQCLAASTPSSQ
jgi:hypothetical protein